MKTYEYILLLSALLPATALLGFSLLVIAKLIFEGPIRPRDIHYAFTSLLGVAGYCGLLALLFWGGRTRSVVISLLLASGIASFLWFTSLGGADAWRWVLTFEEPDEWFLYTWPTVVALYFFVKTTGAKRHNKAPVGA